MGVSGCLANKKVEVVAPLLFCDGVVLRELTQYEYDVRWRDEVMRENLKLDIKQNDNGEAECGWSNNA